MYKNYTVFLSLIIDYIITKCQSPLLYLISALNQYCIPIKYDLLIFIILENGSLSDHIGKRLTSNIFVIVHRYM